MGVADKSRESMATNSESVESRESRVQLADRGNRGYARWLQRINGVKGDFCNSRASRIKCTDL